jgi:hypothetical protein
LFPIPFTYKETAKILILLPILIKTSSHFPKIIYNTSSFLNRGIMASEPEDCKHEEYDLCWSHGELPRCKECGLVGEFKGPDLEIVWDPDPLMLPLRFAEQNDMEGARSAINYLSLAQKDGFTVYRDRLIKLANKLN